VLCITAEANVALRASGRAAGGEIRFAEKLNKLASPLVVIVT
jgi:hypothetical protein